MVAAHKLDGLTSGGVRSAIACLNDDVAIVLAFVYVLLYKPDIAFGELKDGKLYLSKQYL
jgi:hypothetical protein